MPKEANDNAQGGRKMKPDNRERQNKAGSRPDETGDQANIKQNTRNQGYQQDR